MEAKWHCKKRAGRSAERCAMCQHSHQKCPQRHTQNSKCRHLQCKRVKELQSSTRHKGVRHKSQYSRHSHTQQRTGTTRKQSQSLRWKRRCTQITSCDAQLSGVPCASIDIENINNGILSIPTVASYSSNASKNFKAAQDKKAPVTHYNVQRVHIHANAPPPANRASP
jgi:hypothetical protein